MFASGATRVREAALQVVAVQPCQHGKQVNHLFTTTVSRWSRVKNLPRDGTRTVSCGLPEFEEAAGRAGGPGNFCSPYRLHDEAHNDGQTHAAAHHSDDNGRDLTYTEGHSEG